MSGVILPEVTWTPTAAESSRQGKAVELVVLHTWGVRDGARLDSVVNYFLDPAHQVSAHYVYGGATGPDAGRCVQMVPRSRKAWTECAFNVIGISVETTDRVWRGHDPAGLRQLARITAWHLHRYGLPAKWVRGKSLLAGGKGFCRHGDLGSAGCGHPVCPVDLHSALGLKLWWTFVYQVKAELRRGGFRHEWGHE